VLVTLPLGVLQRASVQFVPALPAAKQAAIRKLGSGAVDKIALWFDRPFWPDHDAFGMLAAKRGHFPLFLNGMRRWGSPCLLALVAGSHAKALARESEKKAGEGALAALRTMFGKVPEPRAVTVTRWASDRFALGSHSYLAPGATSADRETLAEPVATKLYFAGEACSRDHPGTMHGALASGRRAALRMLRS
jgi:monoamine oxidase